MKLSAEAFQRFFELHAWAGVVTGLVLYVMFLAGGFTLFHEPLDRWEEPLAQRVPPAPRSLEQQLSAGLAALGEVPSAVWFGPAGEVGEPHFDWQDESFTWRTARLDSTRGVLVPQRERLAHFTYALHYLWHELTGQWLYVAGGLLSLAWLLVLVTGLLLHLKDVVRQFHQFRPAARGRRFWSDLHKVLGTMGLPFQLVFAYSGAFMVLGPLVVRLFVGPVFGGDEALATRVSQGYGSLTPAPAGPPAQVLSADALDAKVKALLPGVDIEAYRVVNHGRANGRFEAWGRLPGAPRGQRMVELDEVTGALVSQTRPGAASELRRWVMGLHFAQFGGMPVRVLFLVLTLAACVTILSGNWVWLSRRPAGPRRVLSRLTVGVGAGAWVAFGALLFASRALPLALPHRGGVEELVFVSSLAACIAWAALARDERALWWKQLALAAALWLPVPVLATRHSVAGLLGPGPRLPDVVGVDVAVLLLGAGLALTARALKTRPAIAPAPLPLAPVEEAGDA